MVGMSANGSTGDAAPSSLRLIKGHGTRNDFLLVPAVDASSAPPEISAELVAALCHRRAGMGADGLIRVVPPGVEGNGKFWFMDHRNADGSLAQMCGNGARVFVRYLVTSGRVVADPDGRLRIATRAGENEAQVHDDGTITISMGAPSFPTVRTVPVVSVVSAVSDQGSSSWPSTGVLMPNPHAVVFVDDLDDAGPLLDAPDVAPGSVFPDGVNVEFVVLEGPGRLSMRVHERGSGETQSCGTGACAAVVAARRRLGEGAPAAWLVTVPGGRLTVTESADGIDLRGPAVLVGEVVINDLSALLG